MPVYTGQRYNIFLPGHLSVFPSILLFVCCQSCERIILKMCEPILQRIGTVVLLGKEMKHSPLGVTGQRSRSQDAKIRFGGLV